MKLKHINFLVVVVGIMFLTIMAIYFTQTSLSANKSKERSKIVNGLSRNIYDMMVLSHEAVLYDKKNITELWLKKHSQTLDTINNLLDEDPGVYKESLLQIQYLDIKIEKVFLEFLDAREQTNHNGAKNHYFEVQSSLLFSLSNELHHIVMHIQSQIVHNMSELTDKINQRILIFISLLSVFLVFAAFFIWSRIIKPIVMVSECLPQFSTGDQVGYIEWQHFDEIGVFLKILHETLEKRKEWEKDLARINQEITFKQLFDSFDSYISIINSDYEYIVVNKKYLDTFGKKEDEIEGHHVTEIISKEEFELFKPEVDKVFLGERLSYESRATNNTGETIYTQKNVSPFYNSDSEIVGVIINAYDITETENLKKELNEKEKMLLQQSKLADMGQMINAIAHQWRQPLNSISLIMQVIHDEDYEDIADRNDLIAKFFSLVEYMSNTIDDFRYYFSKDKGMAYFNIKNEIDKTFSLVDAQFATHSIRSEIQCDIYDDSEKAYQYFGNAGEFRQVIMNIIANARDAIIEWEKEHKEQYGVITATLRRTDKELIITIENNGYQIESAVMSRIFDPYFTTKKEGDGVGIGLYMSKMIIEKEMEGKLYAENTEDGVAFHIVLPICADHDII